MLSLLLKSSSEEAQGTHYQKSTRFWAENPEILRKFPLDVTGDVTELQGSREVLPKLFVMSISGKLSTGEDAYIIRIYM